MTNRFYSANFGQGKTDVAETASTTSGANVEVRVTFDATANSKLELVKSLEVILQKIVEDSWPPV